MHLEETKYFLVSRLVGVIQWKVRSGLPSGTNEVQTAKRVSLDTCYAIWRSLGTDKTAKVYAFQSDVFDPLSAQPKLRRGAGGTQALPPQSLEIFRIGLPCLLAGRKHILTYIQPNLAK